MVFPGGFCHPTEAIAHCPASTQPWCVWGQTTALGTMFPALFVQHVGSLMSPSSFSCGGEADKANSLMSLPNDAIIWTGADVQQMCCTVVAQVNYMNALTWPAIFIYVINNVHALSFTDKKHNTNLQSGVLCPIFEHAQWLLAAEEWEIERIYDMMK